MKSIHRETLANGVKIEVFKMAGGYRAEIHTDGFYAGAPMQCAFRGTLDACREEYKRIKRHERNMQNPIG